MHSSHAVAAVLLAIAAGGASTAQQPRSAAPVTLAVRCVDTAGEPVAGAEVHVFEVRFAPKPVAIRVGEPLRSGADGGCTPVPTANATTWHEHWVHACVPGRLVGMTSPGLRRGDEPVVVTLGPVRRLRGSVGVPAGTDVAAVRVRVRDLSAPGSSPTGPTPLPLMPTSRDALLHELRRAFPGRFDAVVAADGTFVLDEVPATLEPSLDAAGPGVALTQFRVPAGAGSVAVALAAEAVLAGTVLAPGGEPAADAAVTLQQPRRPAALRGFDPVGFGATTAADGRFEIRGLPAGELVLRVEAGAGCRYPQRLELTVAERRTATLRLETGTEIAGVVRAAGDGAPLANVGVSITWDASPWLSDAVLATARSDDQGRFRAVLPNGPAWLTATPRRPFVGNDPLPLDLSRPPGELRALEIVLQRR